MNQHYADSTELAELCDQARDDTVFGLDVEFIREKTYYPQLALIQIAVGEQYVLVDPLESVDLGPLESLMSDPEVTKILHAGSQDLEIFYYRTGHAAKNIFDTQVAAAMLGMGNQISYGALVNRVLGIQLEKGESFTNWLRRPLTPKQETYALDDVVSLLPLYDGLRAELERLGRKGWVAEECSRYEDASYYETDPRQIYRKVKRFGTLDPRGQAVLRELASWREEEARRRDRPRRNIVSDEVLVELARKKTSRVSDLEHLRGLHPREAQRSGHALIEAIQIGVDVPREEWPVMPSRKKLTESEGLLVTFLDAFLKAECQEQEIAAGMVTNAAGIEGVVRAFVEGELDSPEARSPVLHGWRRDLIGDRLIAFLEGKITVRVDAETKRLLFE